MVLLLLIAVLVGALTAITPCVLPVLPALLSASALGGRRRPIGIVLGLGITFTVTIVLLAKLVDGVGLGSSVTRTIAIVILIAFGLVMLIPEAAQRIQAPLSRLARFGPKTRGDGFLSGLGVGGALGFVCAPCAGPVLAAVTAVSASSGPTVRVALIGVFYSLGLCTVLLVYAFAGRVVLDRIRRVAKGHKVERTLGAILLVTGVAMAFNLDVRFEDFLAKHAPSFVIDPGHGLETSHAASKALAEVRPANQYAERQAKAAASHQTGLPNLGPAANFVDNQDWFNTPGDKPLTLQKLRGKVVIVDFWTYTCINCIRTLPFTEGLYKRYHKDGLVVVGVETPEFTFEQNPSNVSAAIKSDGITYPIVQDNKYGTWDAYKNEYWPAEYYVDAQGDVRHTHFGEGDYAKDESIVRELLKDAGAKHLPPPINTSTVPTASRYLLTPETYLNPREQGTSADSEYWSARFTAGTAAYSAPALSSLTLNGWALDGMWTASSQSIEPAASGQGSGSAEAQIDGHVQARDVYLVMTSEGHVPRKGRILFNGKPPTAAERGTDVNAQGYFTVKGQRLYSLVKLGSDANFDITVELPAGIKAYDFTFG